MKIILSWIEKFKKAHKEDVFDSSISLSIILIVLIAIFYLISLFEPQIFLDYFLSQQKNLEVINLSFHQSYFESIDPIRNLLIRNLSFKSIEDLWTFNSFLYLVSIFLVFDILHHYLKNKSNNLNTALLALLICFNLSYLRLLNGTQNVSVLIGVFFFILWQALYLRFKKNSFAFSLLITVPALLNFLLLPLSIFGIFQYYKKDNVKNKILAYLLTAISLGVPLSYKNYFSKNSNYFLLGYPIETKSFLDFGDSVLSLEHKLKGMFAAIGKIILPFGSRDFYQNLSFFDYLGTILLVILLSFAFYSFYKQEKTKLVKLSLALLFSLLWPLVYRNSFYLDKITSLEDSSMVFFTGLNNDDFIAFYILFSIIMIVYINKFKNIKKDFIISGVFIQLLLVSSYSSKIIKTKQNLDTQLRFEESHILLNLAKLYYASTNKKQYNQSNTFRYRVKIDKSKSEKIKFLGFFLYGKLLDFNDPNNIFAVIPENFEKNNFHSLIMIDYYSYIKDFDKAKKHMFELSNNYLISTSRRLAIQDKINENKRLYYIDSLMYLGSEYLQEKKYDEASKYYLISYQFTKTQDEVHRVLMYLDYIRKNGKE